MRCYYTKFVHDIHFDKTRYQQFLREQGLSEHDITHLNILFITDFTLAHFTGSPTFSPDGTYFQHDREYVEKRNKEARGSTDHIIYLAPMLQFSFGLKCIRRLFI